MSSQDSDDDPHLARLVAARLRLRDRFQAAAAASPSQADLRPQGSGPRNRHGMPKLPPDQTETKKWPVLDLGIVPTIDLATWKLIIDGACEHPLTLTWADLMALPQVEDVSDFHCVTKWSRMNMPFVGVRVADVLALVQPNDNAIVVMCHGYDGYTTNVSLVEASKPDVLLAHTADGAPLEREHGGPLRMVTPQLYAWKGAKWISHLELLTVDKLGFWEERGYSNSAYPWRNDRYS